MITAVSIMLIVIGIYEVKGWLEIISTVIIEKNKL
jgi:hypothetical protein